MMAEKEEESKPDTVKLARAYERFLEDLQNEGKDCWADAVDSFLSSVKHPRKEPADVGDEAVLRELHSTANYIKEYQEALNDTNSINEDSDDGVDEDEGEEAADQPGEVTGGVSRIPVPTLSAKAEKLLRSTRALHQQTAELRSFLKDLLSEEKRGDRPGLSSCPELEESTVKRMFSPSRKIAEKRKEVPTKDESLDRCIQMLAAINANDD